jgi:hypothetical protein
MDGWMDGWMDYYLTFREQCFNYIQEENRSINQLVIGKTNIMLFSLEDIITNSEIPLPSDGFSFCYIRKTADWPLQRLVGRFPRFVVIRFYFLSFFYSFITI